MASQLRMVLDRFADQSEPVTVKGMAQEMGIEPGVLHSMIDYWVRKGKLREVNSGATCVTCGVKSACPFVVALPRTYELVSDDDITPAAPCACGGSCAG